MLHFTPEAEPKLEVRRHPLIERFGKSLGARAIGLSFAPVYVSNKPNELIDNLEDEERANTMTVEELESRPDGEELEQFWGTVVEDFRRDGGIDYSED